jgi:signal transduction histidine kinase
MRLRTKFFILVLGVTAIPFLILAFSVLISIDTTAGDQPIHQWIHTQYWMRIQLPAAIEENRLDEIITSIPEGLDLLVISTGDKVLESSISEIEPGTVIDGDILSAIIKSTTQENEVQIQPLGQSDTDQGYLLLRNPASPMVNQGIRRIIGISIPFLLILFASAMSIGIIRNIDKSIRALEEATREIAQGNLDFKLPVRGNDQLASLTRSFNTMQEKLKEEYSRRSRLIMGVSHDLKTPLSLIEGYIDAIEDGYADDPEKLSRYISIIKEKTGLLESRILSLINFVKLETGEWRSNYQDIPMAGFIASFVKQCKDEVSMMGVPFSSKVEIPEETAVRMDPELITRALENIFHNALVYSDKSGNIEIAAHKPEKDIVIEISNKGPRIPEEELPFIFDPFYRGSSSRKENGSGLGLASVKSILMSHGWDIQVKSEHGITSFRITVPA